MATAAPDSNQYSNVVTCTRIVIFRQISLEVCISNRCILWILPYRGNKLATDNIVFTNNQNWLRKIMDILTPFSLAQMLKNKCKERCVTWCVPDNNLLLAMPKEESIPSSDLKTTMQTRVEAKAKLWIIDFSTEPTCPFSSYWSVWARSVLWTIWCKK